jgi:nitroreductase
LDAEFALAASIVYDLALDQAFQERARHGCVRSRRFPHFLPLVSRPTGRSRTGARFDRGRGARGLRRQSAAVAGLRTDRRGTGEVKRQVAAAIAGGDPRHVDAEYPIYPKTMWEPYRSRREHHGVQLYGALNIDRSDAAARLFQYKRNYEFFNAPVALFIAIDRRLGPGQWADLGGYIHTLMFLARGHGLDTCAQESWARMHRIVGPFVNMPPEQMLFCAVSIGYRDRGHPANRFRSPRAEPQEYCRFLGFE